MKNKKELILSFIIIVLIIIILTITLNQKNNETISAGENTYSRDYLQNLVVSTALSYYYNQNNSDYEQKPIDEKSTFLWRNLNYSPEMISRSSNYMIDCSGFASIVYLYSLGYDLSENVEKYYNKTSNYRINFYNGNIYNIFQNAENFQKYYLKKGAGPSTSLMSTLAELYYATKTNEKIENGDKFIGNNQESEFIYYYRTKIKSKNSDTNLDDQNDKYDDEIEELEEETSTCNTSNYEETCEEQEQIKNEIINMLKPGDLLVYRRRDASKNLDGTWNENTYKGHVIVYVGDILQNGEKGFIHSTGSDYNFDTSPIGLGEDTYSVKYDTWENYFKGALFTDNEKDDSYIASYSFTIIRPINKYCVGDSCTITQETVNSNLYKNNYDIYLENAIARNDISRLKVEQYRYKGSAVSTGDLDSKNVMNNNNSINIGDNISYRLVIQNKSQASYCTYGTPSYASQDKCVTPTSLVGTKEFKWQKIDKPIDYKNITIEAKIPENTEFVSCSNNCRYDGNKVKWTNLSFLATNTSAKSYTYEVKVINNPNQIINEGMKLITSNNHTLKLGEIKTLVNPTINSTIDTENIQGTITELETEVSSNEKRYDTELDFIKDIYDKVYNINLNNLTYEDIKNAIYVNSTISAYNNYFVRKYDNEFNDITNEQLDNEARKKIDKINKMLVPGIYGGRMMVGNDNEDRPAILIKNKVKGSLEIGDVLITYDIKNNKNHAWIFYGYDENRAIIFKSYDKEGKITTNSDAEYTKDNNIKTGRRILKEMYSNDLFVVLRPTRVYGTTVRYEANNGNENDNQSFVAYDTYKNLITPTNTSKIKVTLNYNGKTEEVDVNKIFDGWYSDETLNKKVENDTKLVSNDYHTLYAKWKSSIQLPSDNQVITTPDSEKTYIIEGWYSDKDKTNKVGEPGENYIVNQATTLYADLIEDYDYKVNKYAYDEKNIKNIEVYTTVDEFKSNIELNTGYTVEVDKKSVNDKNVLYTGGKTKIYKNQTLYKEYTNIISGDTNGDGKINYLDYVNVYNHIQKEKHPESSKSLLENEYKIAADMSEDNKINYLDYVNIYNKIKALKG